MCLHVLSFTSKSANEIKGTFMNIFCRSTLFLYFWNPKQTKKSF